MGGDDGGTSSAQIGSAGEPSWEELGPKKQFPPLTEADKLGPDVLLTIEELAKWNGIDNRMFVGVCGKVFDVQESENFRPEKGYGKLWAGKDATYSLATLSLKAEDAGKQDYDPHSLSVENLDALKGWFAHFSKKYKVVGKVKEYDGTALGKAVIEALASRPDPKKASDGE